MSAITKALKALVQAGRARQWRMHEEFTAPVGDPPGHTKFILMVDDKARVVTAWPISNWDLINQDWKDKVMKLWEENDITFTRDE